MRSDTNAIRDLCRSLMPLDPAAWTPDPELRAVVHGGVRAFREIARWNASVLVGLDATGQLYLPARSLTGAEVSENQHLVAAKLRGGMVRVPHGQVRHLVQSYDAAAAFGSAVPASAQVQSAYGRVLDPTAPMSR